MRMAVPETSAAGERASAGGAALPGYDLMVQAMSGLMDLTGSPDGPGYRAGVADELLSPNLRGQLEVLANRIDGRR